MVKLMFREFEYGKAEVTLYVKFKLASCVQIASCQIV